RGNYIGKAMKKFVADGELLKREAVPRIQFHSAVNVPQPVFVGASPPRHVTGELKDPGSIGHSAASDLQFSQRSIVITIHRIKMSGPGEMCFACIRLQLREGLQSFLC